MRELLKGEHLQKELFGRAELKGNIKLKDKINGKDYTDFVIEGDYMLVVHVFVIELST